MKQINKIAVLVSLATLGISTANAGVYIGADVGYSKMHIGNVNYTEKNEGSSDVVESSDENNDKALGGIKLGYAFDEGFRTELAFTSYGKIKNNYVDTDEEGETKSNRYVKVNTLMANVYYDFNKTGTIQPYVMAGIGLGMNKTELKIGKSYKDSDTKNYFAYQAGVGAAYKINNNLYADAGIKYAQLGKSSNDTIIFSQSAKVSSFDATVGIRYAF